MARNTELTKKRNQKLIADFNKLDSIKEFGVKKHTFNWICKKIGEKYFLEASQVAKIWQKS